LFLDLWRKLARVREVSANGRIQAAICCDLLKTGLAQDPVAKSTHPDEIHKAAANSPAKGKHTAPVDTPKRFLATNLTSAQLL
jgi:hypothetical protein